MFTPGLNSDSLQGHDSHMSLSPLSPGHQHQLPPSAVQQGHSSPFLPGYLLGDTPSHHLAVSSPRLWSSSSSNSPSQHKSASHVGQMTPSGSSMLIRKESLRGKPGGPPIKSLYSSPASPDGNLSHISSSAHNRSSTALRQIASTPAPPTTGLFQTPGPSRADTSLQALNQSQTLPVSPAQADPFYTQGDLKSDDILDDTWITVFGFPPGATSFILQQFSQYGTIVKHVVASECNWMHIHYLTKMQAKKALSKDGKIYGGCMKIGVTPCIEKTVMEEKENSAMYTSVTSGDGKELSYGVGSSLTPIRPLTAAYVASRGEYEVLKDKPTPKRDASLVTKLKEYMFGY